jgi:hypothetical protein
LVKPTTEQFTRFPVVFTGPPPAGFTSKPGAHLASRSSPSVISFPLILRDSDVAVAEVDHTVFGKCFRESKRQWIKAQRSSPGQRGPCPIQYGPPRSVAYIRSCSFHVIPPTLASADPPEAVCHSTRPETHTAN